MSVLKKLTILHSIALVGWIAFICLDIYFIPNVLLPDLKSVFIGERTISVRRVVHCFYILVAAPIVFISFVPRITKEFICNILDLIFHKTTEKKICALYVAGTYISGDWYYVVHTKEYAKSTVLDVFLEDLSFSTYFIDLKKYPDNIKEKIEGSRNQIYTIKCTKFSRCIIEIKKDNKIL